jgi:hypothetical protein
MAKYHINPTTGNPALCKAKHQCRFGDIETDHFESFDEARAAYEKTIEGTEAWLENHRKEDSYIDDPDIDPDWSDAGPGSGGENYDEAAAQERELRALLDKGESNGLYLYEMDMQDEEHTLTHLFGIAETLEHFHGNDPKWQKLKEKLQYTPSPMGALPGLTTEDLEAEFSDYVDQPWPDIEYARDLHKGHVTKEELFEAVEILHDRYENEIISFERAVDHSPEFMDKLAARADFEKAGYFGHRDDFTSTDRDVIDYEVLSAAARDDLTQDELIQWANSKWGEAFSKSLSGKDLTLSNLQKSLNKYGPHWPLGDFSKDRS